MVEELKAATESREGANAVVVCTTSNFAYAQGLSSLKNGGTLVCLGVPEDRPMPIASADPGKILGKELRILGSSIGTRKTIDCLSPAARGLVKTHFVVKPMNKLEEVFRDMKNGILHGRAVLDLEQPDEETG